MTADDVKVICVIGAGTMGSQIALQCALSGYQVNLTDANAEGLKKGMESNTSLIASRIAKGRITQEEGDAALTNLHAVASLEKAAAPADYVIEAIYENREAKQAVFAILDKVCLPHTILTSNSSTIGISQIVEHIGRKDKCANMHFFHPATIMKLVEVVKGPDTSEETAQVAMEISRRIKKEPVLMQKEVYGFIANYCLHHLAAAAYYLVENGYASVEDVDKALKLGLNHPMGVFELGDFSGLDIGYNARLQRYNETGDPADKPPALLEQMIKEGRLGRKTGRGFYDYTK